MPMPSSAPSQHLKGIACILTGVLCLTCSDALAKALGASYPALQLLFMRAALAAPVLALALLLTSGASGLRTQHIGVHLFRGAINVGTAACFYWGLTMLPLAEATAIAFCAPLVVTLISVTVLGERVSLGAWLAVILGFIGVLVVVRPGPGALGWPALLPLVSAIGYAVLMVSARRLGAGESMWTTMLYIVLGQLVFTSLAQPWVWRPLDWALWPELAGLALFSTLGLGLITQAFRLAPASLVAPFDYTGLIWATAWGWLFWHEVPGPWFYAGSALIAASGMYLALPRQSAKSR